MKIGTSKTIGILILCLNLAGCVQTTYHGFDEQVDNDNSIAGGKVSFELSREFYRDPPACVTVLPDPEQSTAMTARSVEVAVARHLSSRVDRVIGPSERNALVRRHVVNLNIPGDRRTFSALERCRYYIRPTITSNDETYALVWAHRSIGIEMKLFRGADEEVLWRVQHTLTRGDGGLPMLPLSAGMAALRAGMLYNDGEQLPSMIDDALRRMFVTLPDIRDFSSHASTWVRSASKQETVRTDVAEMRNQANDMKR